MFALSNKDFISKDSIQSNNNHYIVKKSRES